MERSREETDSLHREVADRLQRAGQMYTSGRRTLVDLLGQAARPATIPELVASRSGLALSSAYRNLAVLEQVGAVTRILGGGEHARFELAEDVVGDHHHHLICQSCGRVDDFTVPPTVERALEGALAEVAAGSSFVAASHRLDLIGVCAGCSDT